MQCVNSVDVRNGLQKTERVNSNFYTDDINYSYCTDYFYRFYWILIAIISNECQIEELKKCCLYYNVL